MKLSYFPFLFIAGLITIVSCAKMPLESEMQDSDEPLFAVDSSVIWSLPMTLDTGEMVLSNLTVQDDIVVYVQQRENPIGVVQARNIQTGAIIWSWDDINIASGFQITDLKITEHYVIVQSWQDLYVIDIKTGISVWGEDVRDSDCAFPRISIINDYIYYSTTDCAFQRAFCTLWRTPIKTYRPEKVYSLLENKDTSGLVEWINTIEPPSLWINSIQDSVLIFQTRAFKRDQLGNKTDLLAFNLSSKKITWKVDSVTQEGFSSVQPPIIEGNFVYHTGQFSIQKLNLEEKTNVWTFKFPNPSEHFSFTRISIFKDKIYMHPGASSFYILDANSGNQIQKKSLGCCGLTGEIICRDKSLLLISPEEYYSLNLFGEVIKKSKTPIFDRRHNNRYAQFSTLVYSEEKDIAIAFDTHYLFAFKP